MLWRLRPARETDAPDMARVIREAFANLPADIDPLPCALHETAASVLAQLAAGGGSVAAIGARIIGALTWREEDGLRIARLAVPPGWRGQGIARALLAEAEAEARRRGLAGVHLGTRLALEETRRLLRAQGFIETTRHAHAGFSAPTWVRLEKRLVPPGAQGPQA